MSKSTLTDELKIVKSEFTCMDSDFACTVEGTADVGKSVLKVRRGIAIMGKVTAYSPCSPETPHAVKDNNTDTTSSSSSSSCVSELDHALEAKEFKGQDPVNGLGTGAGAGAGGGGADSAAEVRGALSESKTSQVAVRVAVAVAVADSALVAPVRVASIYDDEVEESIPDESDPPDSVEENGPTETELGAKEGSKEGSKEENTPAKLGAEVFAIGKDVSAVRSTQSEGAFPGLWHVLYDDGSEATLAYSELR